MSAEREEESASSAKVEGDQEAMVTSEGFKVPTLSLARPKTKSEASASVEKTAEERLPDRDGEAKTDSSTPPPSVASASSAVPPPPSLPYTEPTWSSLPSESYSLSVIKQGTILQDVQLSSKPFHVFGRLPSCDVQLEHPSISRHHAVLQYRPKDPSKDDSEGADGEPAPSGHTPISSVSVNPKEEGFYVYDLGSTHGTFVNKTKIQPRCFYRLRVGQMVKFGGSSRLFLLEVHTVYFQSVVQNLGNRSVLVAYIGPFKPNHSDFIRS